MKLRKDQRRRRIRELAYLCKQAADRGDELGCWMYAAMVEELEKANEPPSTAAHP